MLRNGELICSTLTWMRFRQSVEDCDSQPTGFKKSWMYGHSKFGIEYSGSPKFWEHIQLICEQVKEEDLIKEFRIFLADFEDLKP